MKTSSIPPDYSCQQLDIIFKSVTHQKQEKLYDFVKNFMQKGDINIIVLGSIQHGCGVSRSYIHLLPVPNQIYS